MDFDETWELFTDAVEMGGGPGQDPRDWLAANGINEGAFKEFADLFTKALPGATPSGWMTAIQAGWNACTLAIARKALERLDEGSK